MMNKIKVNNLETLRYEKARLKEQSKEKEAQLNATLDTIQENAGMIVLRSFFPKKFAQKNSSFEFIHGLVSSSLDDVINIVSDKENRKENIKSLAKNIVSELVYAFVKK